LEIKAADTITYTITIPKENRKYNYVLYSVFIFLTIVAQIIFNFWVITGAMLSITLFIIITLEAEIRLFSPTEVQLSTESIILKYPRNRLVERNWSDVQWLNLWPGDDKCPAGAAIKFKDGRLSDIGMSYEAGRALKNMYISIMGKKPLNYEEYLTSTKGLRWYSYGPSE